MLRSPPFHAPASPAAAAAFDSHPSEVVLIESYLRPWVALGVRPAFVHVADVYSAEPGDLARRLPAAVSRDGERARYFLSPLRTKSPLGRDRRKARTVAGETGCWRSEGAPRPVLDPLAGHHRVGYRQSFSFMKRGDGDGGSAPVRNGWIMVELHLHDGDGGGGDRLEGLVLCKVYRSPRHPDSAPAAALADDDGEESCAAAPAARHSNADDGDGSSDAPLAAAVAASGGSSAATPRRKNAEDVEASGAAAATAPGLKKRAADDENGNSSAAAAPGLKEMAADEDLSASSPAPARKRAKTADDEVPGAASERKNLLASVPATQLHCPDCGFHLGALVVTPAKSTSETETLT